MIRGLEELRPVCAGVAKLRGRKPRWFLVAVEKRGRGTGVPAMEVIPDFKSVTLITFLKQNVSQAQRCIPTASRVSPGCKKQVSNTCLAANPCEPNFGKGPNRWCLWQTGRWQLKQWLIGTHHGVSRGQLQVYLDEFVFRHNRRKLPMARFQTLLGLGTGRQPTNYKTICGAADVSKPDPNTLGSAETTG